MFITFDGPDGVGKTTQTKKLASYLGTLVGDDNVHLTAQPSRKNSGALLRQEMVQRQEGRQWMEQALLFAADRLEMDREVTRPFLNVAPPQAGRVVISDRYTLSSVAYQGALAKRFEYTPRGTHPGDQEKWIAGLNAYVTKPDLQIVMLAPLDVAMGRIAARSQHGPTDRFENHHMQRDVYFAFERACENATGKDFVRRIDADRSEEEVFGHILVAVEETAFRMRCTWWRPLEIKPYHVA